LARGDLGVWKPLVVCQLENLAQWHWEPTKAFPDPVLSFTLLQSLKRSGFISDEHLDERSKLVGSGS
jgi:hypothetical protein